MRKKQILTEFLLFPFVALVVACGKNLDLALPFPSVGDASKFTRPSKAFHRCKVRVAFRQYSFFQSLVNFDGTSYSTLHINNEGVTLRRELFVKIQTVTSRGNGLFESICNTFACFFPRSRRYFQEKENLLSSILEIVYRSESKIYLAYGRNDEHAKKPWVGVVVGVGLF